ncbi:hypothetical protein BH20ACT11_BH20ACT11_07680 [soil metagenome]
MSGRAYHRLPEELLRLAALIPSRPVEAYDRSLGYLDLGLDALKHPRTTYETVGFSRAVADLEPPFEDAREILREPALEEVERRTRELLGDIRKEDTFETRWTADVIFARCCYLFCRLTRPEKVVETGVAHGVSSAFLLAALRENGGGELHSVDLPPLRRDSGQFWGIAAKAAGDTKNWHLHRGASRRVLPGLLEEIGGVGLFVHDSLHTYRNMAYELGLAWEYLPPGGILLADDPERNAAFGEISAHDPALLRVVREVEDSPLAGKAAKTIFGFAVR